MSTYSSQPTTDLPGYSPYPSPYGQPPPQSNQPSYGPPPGYTLSPTTLHQPIGDYVPNCPPGLEYLTQIDQLLVHQKIEVLEALLSCETNNKYEVKNTFGQKVYFAKEDNDCCNRICYGPIRSFDMKILDHQEREVLHFYRPLRCQACCFPCCLQRIEVSASGTNCGHIEQIWSLFTPKFIVCNAAGETVLRIEGPFCAISCCNDVEFQVLSRDGGTQVGRITKQWSGLARELFTDADHFGISFPMDLDTHIKAVLLAACFLIDFMFFERNDV